MKKSLSTESESSLLVEKGLKIIESLSEATTDKLKHKMTDDSIINLSESNIKIYKANLVLRGYFLYFTCTLHVDGAKTFYGHAGGLGSPGLGEFSGNFYFGLDDINLVYQEAKAFVAITTPITVSIAFINSSLGKVAQFNGTGLGTISSTITGGGYWE
ncbi:VapA/VapB family virulence-associated protein [Xenorhabdus anantnagensis]|uniref:VapA/VapB family virulence-associated protein n=1 Tax=Xenorhabdus anantnagensis TaxID=3025875 RepID=A0ABT5LPL1_9GAMM|nr:VapA/VapB family virulence-associated protein [Xenorhabdus anantnagensis]MDC9595778.1 VapA/VapB family virulence-associated protein [Xenorhabdus anantnagensis]